MERRPMVVVKLCALAGATAAAGAGAVAAGGPEFVFNDVGAARGVGSYVMAPGLGGGMAAADFDGDGDIDFFTPQARGVANALYRNMGDGTFEEVGADLGVDSVAPSRAALWLDYDGDGRLDLLVAGDDHNHSEVTVQTSLRLHRQTAGGVFEDVTQAAGLFGNLRPRTDSHVGGLCAGDLNGDGLPDLCVAYWDNDAELFMSDGAGGYVNATGSSGIGALAGDYWQPVMLDVNGDGLLDVFLNNDFAENRLLRNNGDGTFTDIAASANCDTAFNEMGVAVGDYDNDGDFDAYCTNLHREFFGDLQHNVLLRNETVGGSVQFAEVAMELGVENGGFGWGTVFMDADLDGWLDIAESNSREQPSQPTETMRLFHSSGGAGGGALTFADVSSAVGFDQTDEGSGLLAADFDRDGDLDLLQAVQNGPMRMLENERSGAAAGRSWLVVRPRTNGANSHAIGAVVRVSAGGLEMARLITAGVSFQAQAPAEAHFGLGDAAIASEVRIAWADGSVRVARDIEANQVVDPVRGCDADLDLSGDVGSSDLARLLGEWGGPGGAGSADLDGGGSVGSDDLAIMLGAWGACRSGGDAAVSRGAVR